MYTDLGDGPSDPQMRTLTRPLGKLTLVIGNMYSYPGESLLIKVIDVQTLMISALTVVIDILTLMMGTQTLLIRKLFLVISI